MKRSAPLKRTPWPRRRDMPVLQALDESRKVFASVAHKSTSRAVMVPVAAAPAVAVVKHQYVRSKKLLESCREIACQWCGIADGTVVAAHSNALAHHKGKAIKADDNRVASLCHRCHSELDQGSHLTKAERVELWTAAHERTVKELNRLGLWPKNVPQP